jgi:Pvc16 N-terminal domain
MSLIYNTLKLVRQRMNEVFANQYPRVEEWVILSNIVSQDGNVFEESKNKIVMVLSNIQHETMISTFTRTVPIKGEMYAVVTPPLYIDLFLLFYANFFDRNYGEGLTMISETISFFQQNPTFNHDTLPDLDKSIDKLTFEMVNLAISDLNYVMGMMSAKYLPSVYFKVRLLTFQSNAIKAEIPAVQGPETRDQ